MIPSALLPALCASPLAARSRPYRAPAACLAGLAGVAIVRLATGPGSYLLAGVATPYAGAARWAWAVDGAAVIAGAVLRVAVAWVGCRNDGRGCNDRAGVSHEDRAGGSAIAGAGGRLAAYLTRRALQVQTHMVWGASNRFAVCGAVALSAVGPVTAIYLAYPHIRGLGGPWASAARVLLNASAALQLLVGLRWCVARASERAYSAGSTWATVRHWIGGVAPPEWTGLIFAALAPWDLLGALAPGDMVSRWWITRRGNWIGAVAICVVQAWALRAERMRRAGR